MTNQPPNGTIVNGSVETDGDFVGRDKINQNIQQYINVDFRDFLKALDALKQVLPANDSTPEKLLEVLKQFKEYHVRLHEWKELHNYLNDVLIKYGQFAAQLAQIKWGNKKRDPLQLVQLFQLWSPIAMTVDAMLDWGKKIRYIGIPFMQSDQGLQGEPWAVDMYIASNALEQKLRPEKHEDFDSIQLLYAHTDFDNMAQKYMYLADKELKETADELYEISSLVLGEGEK